MMFHITKFAAPIATVFTFASFVLLSFLTGTAAGDEKTDDKITFEEHIGPLLRKHCATCHNPNKKSSDLDVSSLANLLEGGASGDGIEPGDAGNSYLYSLVTYEEGPEMPPTGKIPDEEIELIRKWIDGGALENSGSTAKIRPKLDMAMSESPTSRPELVPLPPRLPLEPALRTARASAPSAIATSPWAPVVAIGTQKQVLLYNTDSRLLLGVLPLPEGQTNSLRFSRNGSMLIGGGGVNGAKGYATLWNIKTGEQIATFGDELDSVLAADLSPDHSLVALGGPQKLVKVFSTVDGSLQYVIKKHTDWVTAIEFSPDGKYLATGDRNGGLQIWYAEDGSEHVTLKAHTKMITGISWRIDGKALVSASEDTTIRIWEAENGKQIKNWASHAPGVTSIEFARDGILVTAGRDKLVRTWKQDGTQIKQFGGLSDVAVAASFCDESQHVIAGDWTGQIRIWNASDAQDLGILDSNPPKLAERLQVAKIEVQKLEQAHAPLAVAVAAMETSQSELTGSLQQAKQLQATKQSSLTQMESQLASAKKQLDSTVAEQNQWRLELAGKNEALPLVADANQKAIQAAEKLGGDEEVTKIAEQLDIKLKQLQARAAELNGLVAKSDQLKNNTQKQVQQLTQTTNTTKSEMNVINQQVAQLEQQVGALNDQLISARVSAKTANQKVDQALVESKRWEQEIAFIVQLKQLDAELRLARETNLAKEGEALNAARKLKEVEAQATFARTVQTEAQQKVEELSNKIRELKNIRQ